ncbi:MAG: hypothetical protein SH848_09955 [Saprospiraceae bacterium]|nr:hypothetical protein [Saprospiraceae bacterium]MDZ4704244.1 hypothetical protein [Saprospiraceae bacterium]
MSTGMHPSGILLPNGMNTITHTINGICSGDMYSEDILVTSGSPNAVLAIVSEACGLVTFSIAGLLPDDTWEIDYGNGLTGTSLVHNYTLTPDTYTATLTVTNDCGTIEIPLEVEIEGCPELVCCPNTSSMLLVNTLISDAIAAGLPPGGTSSDICIEGILMVDEDYTFSGNLFLGPDARIVVTSEATLELDGAHLQGCDFLWQGISVSQPHINNSPSLIIHNETVIEDAKLAVAASPPAPSNSMPSSNRTPFICTAKTRASS